MLDVIKDYMKPATSGPANFDASTEHLIQGLESQMQAYKSYWRDDPEFDRTNTLEACADLPCPDVDQAMLRRMCNFAVRHGFGWPKPSVQYTPKRILDGMKFHERLKSTFSSDTSINVRVSGRGGGQWNLMVSQASGVEWGEGPKHSACGEIYMSSDTLSRLANGTLSAELALRDGRAITRGAKGLECFQEIFDFSRGNCV